MFSLHFVVVSITLLWPVLFVSQLSLSFRLRVVLFCLVVVVVVIIFSVSRPQDRVLFKGAFLSFSQPRFFVQVFF